VIALIRAPRRPRLSSAVAENPGVGVSTSTALMPSGPDPTRANTTPSCARQALPTYRFSPDSTAPPSTGVKVEVRPPASDPRSGSVSAKNVHSGSASIRP
jgi:hypothetical protein